jgi:hypothetical protein
VLKAGETTPPDTLHFHDVTLGREHVLFIATPPEAETGALASLLIPPRDSRLRGEAYDLLDALAFDTGEPSRMRGLHGKGTDVAGMQVVSYEVSWGEPRMPRGRPEGVVVATVAPPDSTGTGGPWAKGPVVAWRSSGDAAYVLLSGSKERVDTVLLDLDRNSEFAGGAEELGAALAAGSPLLDFEVGIRFSTDGVAVLYDTDGKGGFDLQHIDADGDGFADLRSRNAGVGWREEPCPPRTPWLRIAEAHTPGDAGQLCRRARNALAEVLGH